MNEKQLPLVTHEQARRLKKAGFNWECDWVYLWEDGKEDKRILSPANRGCMGFYKGASAPTVALALKWMRDEKELCCGVACWAIGYQGQYIDRNNFPRHTIMRNKFTDAQSDVLDATLTMIENEN